MNIKTLKEKFLENKVSQEDFDKILKLSNDINLMKDFIGKIKEQVNTLETKVNEDFENLKKQIKNIIDNLEE